MRKAGSNGDGSLRHRDEAGLESRHPVEAHAVNGTREYNP
jgi:hypothetical protein